MNSLSLENVSKLSDSCQVLHNITLNASPGKITVIIGPKNSGKSTLLRIFAGMEHPDTGSAHLLLESLKLQCLSQRLIVTKDQTLYPWRTIVNNVGFRLELAKLPDEERKSIVQETIEMAGLEGYNEYFPHQLTHELKIRATIARALATRPDFLLLDEPFADLKESTLLKLQNMLLNLWLQYGQSIVLATENINLAVNLADTIYILQPQTEGVAEKIQLNLIKPRFTNDPQYKGLVKKLRDHLAV